MRHSVLVLFICLFSPLINAEQSIATITLQHRLPSELLPEIQALLPGNTVARAVNDRIILKADSNTIKQIRQLIQQLDTARQRVRLSLLRRQQPLTEPNNAIISGSLVTPVSTWSTQDASDKAHYLQAQGFTDSPISIILTEIIPQHQQSFILYNDNWGIHNNTDYTTINNGFNAVVKLLADRQMIVYIHQLFGDFSAQKGVMETNNIVNSVAGNEGEWILLGAINHRKNIGKKQVTQYHNRQQQQHYIYVKVEQLL